jgi:hypothetical protein
MCLGKKVNERNMGERAVHTPPPPNGKNNAKTKTALKNKE